MALATNLPVSRKQIESLCEKWRIRRLSLFGSILRDDFDLDSDIDVLIAFQPDAAWTLWDWIALHAELEELFGREVDVVEESGLRNPFRRHEIFRTRKVIYGDRKRRCGAQMLQQMI